MHNIDQRNNTRWSGRHDHCIDTGRVHIGKIGYFDVVRGGNTLGRSADFRVVLRLHGYHHAFGVVVTQHGIACENHRKSVVRHASNVMFYNATCDKPPFRCQRYIRGMSSCPHIVILLGTLQFVTILSLFRTVLQRTIIIALRKTIIAAFLRTEKLFCVVHALRNLKKSQLLFKHPI